MFLLIKIINGIEIIMINNYTQTAIILNIIIVIFYLFNDY